jgi:hypothetical protein
MRFILALSTKALLLVALAMQMAWAQAPATDDPNAMERLEEAILADRSIAALFLYPPPLRQAMLTASTRPPILARLAILYADLETEKAAILDALLPGQRQALIRLGRHPSIVARLLDGSLPRKLPPRLRQDANHGHRHQDLLRQLDRLQRQNHDLATAAVESAPEASRAAFLALLRHPELIKTLDRNMRFTVLLGDAYGRDPFAVSLLLEDLSLYLAQNQLAHNPTDDAGLAPKNPNDSYTKNNYTKNSHTNDASTSIHPAPSAPPYRPGAPNRRRTALYTQYGYDTSTLDGPDPDRDVNITYHGYPTYSYGRPYAPLYLSVGNPNLRLSYYGPRYYSYGYRSYHRPHYYPSRYPYGRRHYRRYP